MIEGKRLIVTIEMPTPTAIPINAWNSMMRTNPVTTPAWIHGIKGCIEKPDKSKVSVNPIK